MQVNPALGGKWQEITTNWRQAGLHRVPGHPGTQLNSVSINKVPKSVCTFIILLFHSQTSVYTLSNPQWRDGNHAAPTSQTLPVRGAGSVSSLVRLSYRTPLPFCLDWSKSGPDIPGQVPALINKICTCLSTVTFHLNSWVHLILIKLSLLLLNLLKKNMHHWSKFHSFRFNEFRWWLDQNFLFEQTFWTKIYWHISNSKRFSVIIISQSSGGEKEA